MDKDGKRQDKIFTAEAQRAQRRQMNFFNLGDAEIEKALVLRRKICTGRRRDSCFSDL